LVSDTYPCSHCCTSPYVLLFFFQSPRHPRALHSFPTRRSSDLVPQSSATPTLVRVDGVEIDLARRRVTRDGVPVHLTRTELALLDRKSTRLNSSHLVISYAVFCLKKKKNTDDDINKLNDTINDL